MDTSKQVGDPDHLKVFANAEAAATWFAENGCRVRGSGVNRAGPLAPCSFMVLAIVWQALGFAVGQSLCQ